jgi:hypothetical protein
MVTGATPERNEMVLACADKRFEFTGMPAPVRADLEQIGSSLGAFRSASRVEHDNRRFPCPEFGPITVFCGLNPPEVCRWVSPARCARQLSGPMPS